jgi:hypothetical protein
LIPRWLAIGLGALLAAGLLPARGGLAELSQQEQAAWSERLEQARTRRLAAFERLGAAEAALRSQRQRRHPRGLEKARLLADLERARDALIEAELALPELIEEARRAGVPPGQLRLHSAQTD